MKRVILAFAFLIFSIGFLLAEEKTYEFTEEELSSDVTVTLAPTEKIKIDLDEKEYYIKLNSLLQNSVQLRLSENKPIYLDLDAKNNPSEIKIEFDYDNFYDILIKLTKINFEKNAQSAEFQIQKIHEEVPENAESDYSCYKSYVCSNGKKIKQCESASSDLDAKCRCTSISESDCEKEDEEQEDSEETEEENETEIEDNQNEERKRERFELKTGAECPSECECAGATIKCEIEGQREMTIYAGNSGNIIVQIKGVNISTNVTLYKENESIFGNFSNETRKIKFFPDEAKEKLKETVKVKLSKNETEIELNSDGNYEIQTKKEARFLGIFKTKEKVKAEISAESGEVLNVKNSWWGFLANDVEEK